jgi:hypothetical protein
MSAVQHTNKDFSVQKFFRVHTLEKGGSSSIRQGLWLDVQLSQFAEETTVVDSDILDAAVGTIVAAAVVVANAAVGTAANDNAVGKGVTACDVVVDCTAGASVAGDNGDFAVDDTNVMTGAIVVAAVAEVGITDGTPTVVDDNV